MTRTWTFRIEERAWTMNATSSKHWAKTSALKKRWKEFGKDAAQDAGVPPLTGIRITTTPHFESHAHMTDVAAEAAAIKAFIDGLMEADVCPDDNPRYVRSLTYESPVVDGWTGHEVTITEAPTNEAMRKTRYRKTLYVPE